VNIGHGTKVNILRMVCVLPLTGFQTLSDTMVISKLIIYFFYL